MYHFRINPSQTKLSLKKSVGAALERWMHKRHQPAATAPTLVILRGDKSSRLSRTTYVSILIFGNSFFKY